MFGVSLRSIAVLFCLSLLEFVPAVHAAVVLIDQTTSTNGLPGCPHAGFPIIICKPGSYRLSGNLTTASVSTDVIDINAGGVTLDMNGFSIIGPVTCTPSTYPVQCTGGGPGIGIFAPITTGGVILADVTIRNGNIRGMGAAGIVLLASGNLVNDVHVTFTGTGAVNQGIPSPAIYVQSGVITHCTAYTNAGSGMGGGDETVSFSNSVLNGGFGFDGGSVVSNSSAGANGQDGFHDFSLTLNSVAANNIGFGIRNDSTSFGYLGDVFAGNKGGSITGGTSMGQNLCNGTGC